MAQPQNSTMVAKDNGSNGQRVVWPSHKIQKDQKEVQKIVGQTVKG